MPSPRWLPSRALAAAAMLLAAACGDASRQRTPLTAPDVPVASAPRASSVATAVPPTPGTCVTPAALETFVNAAFGAGSPDANSVLGKVGNLVKQVENANAVTAKERAFDIVTFVLAKNRERPLPGGNAAVTTLANAVFCYAGLALTVSSDLTNTFLVFPGDAPQTLRASDGQSGTQLPENPVFEPTLITFRRIPPTDFPVPGTGPLSTKLDQYPGYYDIAKSSETDQPLRTAVVVAICPTAGVPTDPALRARLRLGHDRRIGFEITPPADGGFLTCVSESASLSSRLGRMLASAILPRDLHAAVFAGGGVGGLATEFSPFGLVDPVAFAGGGVGGLATEFRAPLSAPLGAKLGAALAAPSCEPVEAPIGTPLPAACRPQITVSTPLGTPLLGVPVTFAPVTGTDGQVAVENAGTCGAFGETALASTVAGGVARACWTLGLTPGAQTLRGTPAAGGDANSPFVQFTPASVRFGATANPPVALIVDPQPVAGSTIVAGTTIPVGVRAVDRTGTTVLGWSGPVALTLNQFGFAGGTASVTGSATQGVVSFGGVSITRAATGYRLTASADLLGTPASTLGNLFAVGAAAPVTLVKVQGDALTAATGSVTAPPPTVAVRDAFDNPVEGASIAWTAGGTSGGSVSPLTSPTSALGQATTSWTLGSGANELLAVLTRPNAESLSALFTATGTSTVAVLNSCPVGGSGDAINGANRRNAFWIPNPGRGRTIREVQLYLSSAGRVGGSTANLPYTVELSFQIGSFDPAMSPRRTVASTFFLRGNNSENKVVTFTLPPSQVIVGTSNGPPVLLQLNVTRNPDESTVTFNTGPCSPGTSCRPPRGCEVTQVSNVLPFPTGTAYRRSVAIVVRGS